MFQCFNVSMFQCFNVSMFQCFNVSMFQCFNVSMFQCFNVSMFQCLTGVPTTLAVLCHGQSVGVFVAGEDAVARGRGGAVVVSEVYLNLNFLCSYTCKNKR
jgi:hypothetical protein